MSDSGTRRVEIVFVLAPTQNAFFFELAEILGHELTGLGVVWRIVEDGFPAFASYRVPVLLPPHEYAVLGSDDPALEDDAMLARTIGICTEQPSTSHFYDNHRIIGRLGRTFDISRFAVAETRARGLAVEHLQLGYTPLLDVYDPGAPRDLDVAFLGCRSDRRDFLVASLAPVLAGRRCQLVFSDNSRPNARDAAANAFVRGAAKRALLARARILLNLHQSDIPYFEWVRAVEAISAGAVVVTDTAAGLAPLVPGRHLFVARPDALPDVLAALLEDDARLQRVRQDAYDLLRRHLTLRRAAESLVRAARTVAARPTRGARRHALVPARCTVPAAFLEDAPVPARPHLPPVTGTPAGAALKRLRLDVMDLRRDLAGGTRSGGTSVVARTAAHRVQRGARVSTITALYNHADLIGEALDSLLPATGADTEIVVVDDGSTDGSRDAVLGWLRRHEHVPAVVLAHAENRGLPHARNTAIAFARGDLMFVLDADNTIFPACLHRLEAALQAEPDAAFAYPLIERRDVFGTLGLHAPFAWDPARLRRGNYIDAMAMIRRDVLCALGGYGTDRRLYGWEDYDLWCRIAELGGRGVLVPEVLARYRESPSSMRCLMNVDHTEAYAALFERSPRLFAGILPVASRAGSPEDVAATMDAEIQG